MTPPKFVPWTPEEDKLLTTAVAACEPRFISLNLAGPAYDDDPCVIGGTKICWKHVAKSMPGAFDRHLSSPSY